MVGWSESSHIECSMIKMDGWMDRCMNGWMDGTSVGGNNGQVRPARQDDYPPSCLAIGSLALRITLS